MTKFIPLVDTNTKQVLQWTMKDNDGNETVISITKAQWKHESSWTVEELDQLFNITTSSISVEEAEEVVEDSVVEPLVLIMTDSDVEKKDF